MKTVLLTGATGFIGRNILEQLSSGFYFLHPNHQELDLLDQKAVEKYFRKQQIDAIIHAAVVGAVKHNISDKNLMYPNLRMFFNLIRARNIKQKFIFFGSGAEYDKDRPIIRIKESDFGKRIPSDEYGFYKYVCSKYIETAENIINLRLFGVYGKYEELSRFISETIIKCLNNQSIVIKQNVKFDYLYINDLVKIVKYFLQHKPKYKFYNISSGHVQDIKSIAKKIININGEKTTLTIQKPGWQNEYSCSISRLKSEIPDLKFTDFKQSINEMIKFYRKKIIK